jgi:hypothetical protein
MKLLNLLIQDAKQWLTQVPFEKESNLYNFRYQ